MAGGRPRVGTTHNEFFLLEFPMLNLRISIKYMQAVDTKFFVCNLSSVYGTVKGGDFDQISTFFYVFNLLSTPALFLDFWLKHSRSHLFY